MRKLVAFCFLLSLLVFISDETMVLMADAKDCHKTWTCKGEDRCFNDCKNQFNGKGLCDLGTAPFVPRQCFCAYQC
ncbi:putative defensin-like protein 184 [Actinidia eriantha]|uniref:putative defensin-like protein 184 n=1 Tax=Actinidia eriantha TaxID=165200 RepID=UPI00258D5B62|nr:putative defensin-like protein 184 [Actinidia eriantha]